MRSLVIAWGFARFFLWALLEEGGSRFVPRRTAAAWQARCPLRLVRLLERLGGAFIKFGQLLSMRVDLLPKRYCDALSGLYDHVPPFPSARARAVVEAELGAPIGELFLAFDDAPIGAASFGQVHRVVLGRGDDKGSVAVLKIQRPDVESDLDLDAIWLVWIGHFIDVTSALGRIKLAPVFRDFVRWTRRELNFTQEAKNADRLYEETEENRKQRIPYIYWDYTTPKVMAMEFLEGMSVASLIQRVEAGDAALGDDLAAIGCDIETLSKQIYENFCLQAFVGEVFHGDPHPGNLIILPDNVIGYVDFGLLGRMSPENLREQLAFVDACARKDIEKMFLAVLDILDAPRGLLVSDYYETFYEQADAWLDASDNPGASLAEKSANNFVTACMELARAIGIPLQLNTTLFYKALISVDSCVLRLAPRMDYHRTIRGALRVVRLRMLEKHLTPNAALDRTLNTWLMLMRMPDLVAEQILNYQATTRSMYRRINRAPLVMAGVARSLGALCFFTGLALLPVDRGATEHLPGWLIEGVHLDALRDVSSWFPVFFLLTLVLFWAARILGAHSMVKVGRE